MLTQLSRPTVFNINIFSPELWGDFSTVIVMGIGLWLILFVVYWFTSYDLKKEHKLLTLLVLAWLPFGFGFFVNSTNTLRDDSLRLKKGIDQNVKQTICQMDEAQHLGGVYCSLVMFIADVKKNLPVGAKIKLLVHPNVLIYPKYYLYNDYRLVDKIEQADYLLFYATNQNFGMDKNGVLQLQTENSKIETFGRWQIIAQYNPQILILKRL